MNANEQTVENIETYMKAPKEKQARLKNYFSPGGALQRSILWDVSGTIYRRINAYVDPVSGEAGPVLKYPIWQFQIYNKDFHLVFGSRELTRLDELFKSLS
jgi:hypothetical protein